MNIYDQDSVLPLPCAALDYIKQAFQFPKMVYPKDHQPKFRIIHVLQYLKYFSSNRSHMIVNNKYMSPPPNWPMIQGTELLPEQVESNLVTMKDSTSTTQHNLHYYWDVAIDDSMPTTNNLTFGSGTVVWNQMIRSQPLGCVFTLPQLYKFISQYYQ